MEEKTVYKNLGLIVAIGQNNEIGYQNDLIWRIKEDLQYFKETTMNSYLIMGKNTYLSMPKNLKGRKYIVLSRNPEFTLESPKIVTRSVSETLNFVSFHPKDNFFVVGGGTVYNIFLPYIEKMHITQIEETFSPADTHFPEFDMETWHQVSLESKREDHLNYKRLILERKQSSC